VQLGDRASEGDRLAELEQSQLADRKLKIDQAITQAKQDLQNSTGTRLASLQQQIQKLEAQQKEVELELKNGVIVAPYAALITERSIDPGTLVSSTMPAFQIIEDAPPLVEVSLPRTAAAQLAADEMVLVGVGNTQVVAKIIARSPLQDPAGSQKVLLEFADALSPDSWAYGQVVEVRFLNRTGNSGFWLPLSALQRNANGLWSVFVAQSQADTEDAPLQVARRMLEIVQLEDDQALVQGSLNEGDLVIVNGTHRIVPGQQVTTINVSGEFATPFQAGAAE
jgi:RND family efflux transporter MFP subunit